MIDLLRGRWFRRFLAVGVMTTTGLAVAVSTASAQDARQTDLSVGYLNVIGSMHGGNVQVTTQISRRWSLVGEFDASTGRDCGGCEPVYRDLAGLGGVRYGWRPTTRVSPFWQVLAGGLRSGAADYYVDYCCGLGRQFQEGYAVDYLALQPGGGVTAMVNRRFGVRAQADIQLALTNSSLFEPGEGYSV